MLLFQLLIPKLSVKNLIFVYDSVSNINHEFDKDTSVDQATLATNLVIPQLLASGL